jgi:hypothetical protein
MATEQLSVQEQIINKALEDETFRLELLNNPKDALKRELGITFPEGVSVQVYQNTPTTLHLMVPPQPQSGKLRDLSDEDLEQIAGGRANICYCTHDDWSGLLK